MKYGNGITPPRNTIMWFEAAEKRKCITCKLHIDLKSGKMKCEPIGEIKEPDWPYCSFYNLKALVLKIQKAEETKVEVKQ